MPKHKDIFAEMVDQIIDDLSNRRGIGQGWDQIDKDIQEDIRREWITICYEVYSDRSGGAE